LHGLRWPLNVKAGGSWRELRNKLEPPQSRQRRFESANQHWKDKNIRFVLSATLCEWFFCFARAGSSILTFLIFATFYQEKVGRIT
jgi:hypothetical protein